MTAHHARTLQWAYLVPCGRTVCLQRVFGIGLPWGPRYRLTLGSYGRPFRRALGIGLSLEVGSSRESLSSSPGIHLWIWQRKRGISQARFSFQDFKFLELSAHCKLRSRKQGLSGCQDLVSEAPQQQGLKRMSYEKGVAPLSIESLDSTPFSSAKSHFPVHLVELSPAGLQG